MILRSFRFRQSAVTPMVVAADALRGFQAAAVSDGRRKEEEAIF